MKLIFVAVVVAVTTAARLDNLERGYLPPSNANFGTNGFSSNTGSSGNGFNSGSNGLGNGLNSGNSVTNGYGSTAAGSNGGQRYNNGFGTNGRGSNGNGNGGSQDTNGYASNGNGGSQGTNGYSSNGNGGSQGTNGYASNGNGGSQGTNGYASNGNGGSQGTNGYSSNGNGGSQGTNGYSSNGNGGSQGTNGYASNGATNGFGEATSKQYLPPDQNSAGNGAGLNFGGSSIKPACSSCAQSRYTQQYNRASLIPSTSYGVPQFGSNFARVSPSGSPSTAYTSTGPSDSDSEPNFGSTIGSFGSQGFTGAQGTSGPQGEAIRQYLPPTQASQNSPQQPFDENTGYIY